ncbi:MAG: oligosaccharide flippase family protein [Bacteroidales bacterium]|nr:oligosaccharide flippase family protein [Bacteroidales bacterium]
MPRKFHITNILGLQLFQVLRFVSFLIISAVFTRTELTKKDIGDFELLLFLASALTFFWITGIIQSLLPLFNNNSSFVQRNKLQKSPELYNAFLLLLFISFFITAAGFILKDEVAFYKDGHPLPYATPLLLYIFLSSPSCLNEYIYLLYNKASHILIYGLLTFTLQVIFAIVPVHMGFGIEGAIWGLVAVSAIRFIWLLILLKKYSVPKVSFDFLKELIILSLPLMLSTLLSGSSQYIDGLIVSAKFSPEKFAIFRYGAKEVPLVVTLASGLNNAMLTQFASIDKIKYGLLTLKKRSLRLMHILFPISILLLFFSDILFHVLFTRNFVQSSDVFMVYVLLITSRLIFPQTILIGLKKNKVVMFTSILNIVLNIGLTLLMIPRYGIVGVAVATVIIYVIEKLVLVAYNYFKLGIKPTDYIPVGWYVFYSSLITLIFVLIDHRILVVRLY